MNTYEITYEVKVVINAKSQACAVADSTDILWNGDMGLADFAITTVYPRVIVDGSDYEMSI
jgi:hypothetical protein